MKNDLINKGTNNYPSIIKGAILHILVTAVFVFLFALVMYFTESGYDYATLFATISVAAGTLASAFYIGRKIGSKGLLLGAATGGITFALVTLVSLIVDKGGITSNTLFHFIIILLSGLIGGVLGVNRTQNKKYI
ncbi:MAG: TIGR04086 family membrane protein [Clostridia bacterium]|nr:TIGR04086 family membrane protein [Clostridia bacterium]